MASTDGIVIDLNDPRTLELYSQILLFKNNPSQEVLVFSSPDKSKQRILQSLAHKLDLECEYALATRSLTISRPTPEEWIDPEAAYDRATVDNLLENVGGVFGDAFDGTGPSFSPFLGDDFSFDIPQPAMDTSVSGLAENFLRCDDYEAARIHVDEPNMPEDGVPPPPNQTLFDSARPISIVPQNESSGLMYGEELDLESEDFFAAIERGLFPEPEIVVPPLDLDLPIEQSFSGHEKNKQKSALDDAKDVQQSRDSPGLDHSDKTHMPMSMPDCQSTLLPNVQKEPDRPTFSMEGKKEGQDFPLQTYSISSLTHETELVWNHWDQVWEVPPANANVHLMANGLNQTDSEHDEAIRAPHCLPFSLEKSSKKRKNAERSVSPILNNKPSSITPNERSVSLQGGPEYVPPENNFLENVRSKIKRIMCLQSQCNRTFSRQSSLGLHIGEDHHVGAKLDVNHENTANQTTSVNSDQKFCGRSGVRNSFSRRSSLEPLPSPSPLPSPLPSPRGYEEIVFDARSDQSSGHASLHSNASVASGRRGPLNEAARKGMRALKDIGACWRCKFLRKPCDPEARCGWCPRSKDGGCFKEVLSAWAELGCQRGTFQSATHPIVLCPKSYTIFSSEYDYPKYGSNSILGISRWMSARQQAIDRANQLWRTGLLERDTALKEIGHSMTGHEGSLSPHSQHLRELFSECFPGSVFSTSIDSQEAMPEPARIPLNECILAIAWESPTSELESLARLLPQAAAYQVGYEDDRLIAQSLICLRSCLEATRMKSSYNKYGELPHDRCVTAACQIECIAELKGNISLYLEELSRVFFKKANMSAKQQWWLSAFYSFCIQSWVKKVLLELEDKQSEGGYDACQEYLQLPIKLFIAVSNKYDQLLDIPNEVRAQFTYKKAQIAVDSCKWKADGISGSAEYLRRLFSNSKEAEPTKSAQQHHCRQEIIEID